MEEQLKEIEKKAAQYLARRIAQKERIESVALWHNKEGSSTIDNIRKLLRFDIAIDMASENPKGRGVVEFEFMEACNAPEEIMRIISSGLVFCSAEKDLFTVPAGYALAHCISADFGMGKGIVVEFNKRFDMKNKIKAAYPDYLQRWKSEKMEGDCIRIGSVLNLITKERYWGKPTYDSIAAALRVMREVCLDENIGTVAMPVIGCGLDGLDWNKVSKIIHDVFDGDRISILVCQQKK